MGDDFAGRLRVVMAERGLGVLALARRVPCDKALISRLASGKQRPSEQIAHRLDDALAAGGELAALAATAVSAAGAGELGLIDLARRQEVSDVGNGTLNLLTGVVDDMCRDYPVQDAAVLSARALRHLKYVTSLAGGRTTLAQHKELLVIAGWLAALLACTRYDAGDRPAAEAARRMVWQFGSEAGHAALVAWSFEIAAWFALVEGRYHGTVALSEAGAEHAGETSAAVQLALQSARGYARMGDTRARDALNAGQAALARLPVPEHPEHHFVFDVGKYEFYVATILTWLGDDAVAEEHAREVVWRCEEAGGWPTRLGTTLVNLGLIAGRRGDLDEAVGYGAVALRLPRRSAELLPRAAELHRSLDAAYPGERLVDEFSEMLAGQDGPAAH
jgi:transcriptional regulator with XRE-family HTH domain